MEGRLARLEARLEELTTSLKTLEARLDGLEAGAPRPPAFPPAVPAAGPLTPAASEGPWAGSLQHLGKSLLVLGGAFLIRALTDGGTLPRGAGIALGLAYAVAWIVVADRAGARGRGLAAAFFGSTAIFIACPLALEGATRFGAFSASAAAALLAAFTGLTLAIAWRRDLAALAWVSTLAALATLLVLLLTAYAVAPVSAALLLLGAATVGLAYSRRHWHGPRWFVAAAVDLVVVLMTWLASKQGGVPEPYRGLSASAAFWLALALPVIYVGSAALRTLVRRRDVSIFEALQSVASLLIGLGGAAAVSRASSSGSTALGAAGLLLAAACYGAAFAFVERRHASARNFRFYAYLALGLALYASGLIFQPGPLAALWALLALAAALLGARLRRGTLQIHAAIYLAAAALASGLAAAPLDAFLGAARLAPPLSPWAEAVLVAGASIFFVFLPAHGVPWPRLPAALVCLAGVGSLAAWLAVRVATDGRDPGAIAAARTGVLALSALLLAAAWRWKGLPELKWLAYGVLACAAAKILLQDVPEGRPASLVAALALYGLALTFAPRWLRAR